MLPEPDECSPLYHGQFFVGGFEGFLFFILLALYGTSSLFGQYCHLFFSWRLKEFCQEGRKHPPENPILWSKWSVFGYSKIPLKCNLRIVMQPSNLRAEVYWIREELLPPLVEISIEEGKQIRRETASPPPTPQLPFSSSMLSREDSLCPVSSGGCAFPVAWKTLCIRPSTTSVCTHACTHNTQPYPAWARVEHRHPVYCRVLQAH